MAAALNGIGMLLLIAISLLALIFFPRSPTRKRQLFGAAGLGSVYILAGSVLSMHLCDAGDPAAQYMIPGVLLIGALYLLRPPYRWGVALTIAGCGVLLTIHAASAIHSGFPTNAGPRSTRIALIRLSASLRNSGIASLPAGPVQAEILRSSGDLPLDAQGNLLAPAYRAHWYTYITGMYERYETPKVVHFDGGDFTAENLSVHLHLLDPAPPRSPPPSTQAHQVR